MGTIIINGKRMSFNGGSVSVTDGKIIVDGKSIELDDSPIFNIVVEGNAEDISGDFAKIVVTGDAQKVKTMSGDIKIEGDVTGKASTMSGDIRVKGSIYGDAETISGDIS